MLLPSMYTIRKSSISRLYINPPSPILYNPVPQQKSIKKSQSIALKLIKKYRAQNNSYTRKKERKREKNSKFQTTAKKTPSARNKQEVDKICIHKEYSLRCSTGIAVLYQEKASSMKSILAMSILARTARRTSSLREPLPQTVTPMVPILLSISLARMVSILAKSREEYQYLSCLAENSE